MVERVRRLGIASVSVLVGSGLAGCGSVQQQAYEPQSLAVYTYQINGLTVRTGDLICTSTTEGKSVFGGLLWELFGIVIPGPVDHIAVYVGPGGRCVEAGALYRVAQFTIKGNTWDPAKMILQRGPLLDQLYGVVYPLAGLALTAEEEAGIRKSVAAYCLRQARAGKLYNALFVDSMTENAFYCSQLAYRAYLEEGIDLNTGQGVPDFPGLESIVFPQEIWSGCVHERPPGSGAPI